MPEKSDPEGHSGQVVGRVKGLHLELDGAFFKPDPADNYMLKVNNRNTRGEWPSGLSCCSKNQKVPSSNPTRRSVGLRDPISLRGSW